MKPARLVGLRMVRQGDDLPSERPLPSGCDLRAATPDDAEPLALLLTVAFEELWIPARVRAELLEHPQVPATFVIVRGGSLLATASLQKQGDEAWLHWVAAAPEARGCGLGAIVSRRVLAAARDLGRSRVLLNTDHDRLPAIRTYLRLGFAPDPCEPSHRERWRAVLARLG